MSLTIEENPSSLHPIGKNGDAYYELESTRFRVPDEETGDITQLGALMKLTLTTGTWAQAVVGDIVLIENSVIGYNGYNKISAVISTSSFALYSSVLDLLWFGDEADLKVTLISKYFNVIAEITIDSSIVFTSISYPELSGSDYLIKYFLSKVLRKMIEYIIVDPEENSIISPSTHKNSLPYTIDFTARQMDEAQVINDVAPAETVSQTNRYAFPVIFDERYKIHNDTDTLPTDLSDYEMIYSSPAEFLTYADRDDLKIIRGVTELYFAFIHNGAGVRVSRRYDMGIGYGAWSADVASTILVNNYGILPVNNAYFTGSWKAVQVKVQDASNRDISETLTIENESETIYVTGCETTMIRYRNTLGGLDVIRYKERDEISTHSREKYETSEDIAQYDTRSERRIYLTKKQLTNNKRLMIDEMMASSFIEVSRTRGSTFEWVRAIIKDGSFLSVNDEEDIHSLEIQLKNYLINV
jgi:hypothetical protein